LEIPSNGMCHCQASESPILTPSWDPTLSVRILDISLRIVYMAIRGNRKCTMMFSVGHVRTCTSCRCFLQSLHLLHPRRPCRLFPFGLNCSWGPGDLRFSNRSLQFKYYLSTEIDDSGTTPNNTDGWSFARRCIDGTVEYWVVARRSFHPREPKTSSTPLNYADSTGGMITPFWLMVTAFDRRRGNQHLRTITDSIGIPVGFRFKITGE